MQPIKDFESLFIRSLPETYALLTAASLVVHPRVSAVVLHGSRGPGGGWRPDSDIDLSLLVDPFLSGNIENELQAVVTTTLAHWQSEIEPDLAVIFDIQHCGLQCFEKFTWDNMICRSGGGDCFGLYKIQKGFNGLVTNAGVQVRLMYPYLKIWRRSGWSNGRSNIQNTPG